MADKPISFSAPMVRALIEGRKTQTRRIIKGQPQGPFWFCDPARGGWRFVAEGGAPSVPAKVPWRLGDRLWVREAWRTFVSLDDVAPSDLLTGLRGAGIAFEAGCGVSISKIPQREFRADYSLEPRADRAAFSRLRAAMHMPRWASRTTLHVTGVRVQRLQDINENDAKAEGVKPASGKHREPRVAAFADLWHKIHGSTSWSENPWVAAISFRTILANIDAQEARVA
jgi:hypothetical protein